MKNQEKNSIDELFSTIDNNSLSPKSRRILLTLCSFFLVIIGGFLYYELYHLPQEEKIEEKVWVSILDLKNRNYQDAFFGTDDHYGFDALANEYAFAPSTKIAKYGAGVSALQLNKYDEAIDYLSNVNFEEALLQTLTKMALGDAYIGNNKPQLALDAYKKSWYFSKKTSLIPVVGKKLGLAYEDAGQHLEALNIYKEVMETSDLSSNITKNIQKLIAKIEQTPTLQ